jgi:DNA helicase HerA-like ATPase
MDLTKVRMREHSGMLTNDTTTTQFTFVVSPLKNRATLEENDYIAINHPTLGENYPILATVTEIKSYEQVAGSTLSEKVGKMMATAQTIGYVDIKDKTKQIQKLVTPPNPGSRVYMVYSEFLETVFTTDTNGKPYNPPLSIGTSTQTAINQNEETKQINYYLDPQTVTNNHTLIAANDQTGKTYTATIIIEELANKTNQPIIVFDPYNEYAQPGYKTTNTTTTENITVKPKQVTVITAQNQTPENKASFYSQTLKTLWNARLQETIPPFTLVIENAEKLDTNTLEQVVYEGPKHGVALILVTKQPTQLGNIILSQMSTQIIGKTTDNNYLNQLKTIIPQHAEQVPQLKPKQWIINTNSQQQTTQITTRKRNTKTK